jgi:hypothetical protein
MGNRYVVPSSWPAEALPVVDEANGLLDAAEDAGTAEAAMLRRRAEAIVRRLNARFAPPSR